MRQALISVQHKPAGILKEVTPGRHYIFEYLSSYRGVPASLTMPVRKNPYRFDGFPPFFDGLLPEGYQLEALLRARKLDRSDFMAQLLAVGKDLIGDVTVEEAGRESLEVGEG